MTNRRYLRAYLYDFKGKPLPPLMRGHKVSTALLPTMKLQGMAEYAKNLIGVGTDKRRDAAVRCLVEAQKRSSNMYQPIFAVALVVCPDRRSSAQTLRIEGRPTTLNAFNAYLASFAAVGDRNQIWAGDIMRESLPQIEDRLRACIAHVRNEPFERLSELFESVSM